MIYDPHSITYGYDVFSSDNINYNPLNLDPTGRNFEYDFNNSPDYISKKENLPLSYDPLFINNNLNKTYIDNKNNIENYFINERLSTLPEYKNNKIDDMDKIPEDRYSTRKYYFPAKEHMTNIYNSTIIKNMLILLIIVYIILNIIIYNNEHNLNLYKNILSK